jgi:predicted aconitase
LNKEEERIYNGEAGWANQKCMQILVRLGELFDADRLIPVEWAHVSGVSYKTLGDCPIEYLETLADKGAKVRVKTTLNPQSVDESYLSRTLPKTLVMKQQSILEQFDKMGLERSLTCTPYYLHKVPPNSHLAWAESSATVYANSVLDAKTNREGGPSALASAIIGKTPNYGAHVDENRRPTVSVKIEAPLRNEAQFGALGIHLGKIIGQRVPAIRGLKNPSKNALKQFGAGLATTGMTSMFHYSIPQQTKGLENITIEAADIEQTIENLTTSSSKPNLVFLGCPHCSTNELRLIGHLAEGKKVKHNTEFWVCISCHIAKKMQSSVRKIERCGGHVLEGVCTVVSWPERLGIKTIMTNSAKTAYYAPTLNKAQTILAPMKQCLKAAFEE